MHLMQHRYHHTLIHAGEYGCRSIHSDLARVNRLLKDLDDTLLYCSSQLPKNGMLILTILNLLLCILHQCRKMIDRKRQQVRSEQKQALPNVVSGCNYSADASSPFLEHGMQHTHEQVFLALRKVVV